MSSSFFSIPPKWLTLAQLKRLAAAIYREIEQRKNLMFATPKDGDARETAKRYRDPDNQFNVWNGRGRRPKWLKEQLGKGRTLEEMEISEEK